MTFRAKSDPSHPTAAPIHPVASNSSDVAAASPVHGHRKSSGKDSSLKLFSQNGPILVKNIRMKLESGGTESVFIQFDSYQKPAFLLKLDGDEPKISVILKNAKLSPRIQKSIHAGGKFLRRIRTGANGTNGELNIILDIYPRSSCQASYTHCLGANLFRIDISAGSHK
ncbi:MAG: hypothetical protein HPY65_09210 [Syntrophaceae bacterium]|nr:hypothetical protein [Syntrophaceae bacterium]